MHLRRILVLCAFAMVTTPGLAASEAGNMMKMTVTVTVNMAGLPLNLPPTTHTQDVCTSAKKPDPRELTRQQKDCRLTDYKEVGNTISYRLQCDGKMQMTGEGSLETQTNGNLRGTMHLAGTTNGQAMAMDVAYDGQRTGSCDYQPPAA